MIRVELLRAEFDGRTVDWQRLALIQAQGEEVTCQGDASLLNFDVPVVDLRNKQQLLFNDNPEEWVRGLPTMFRGGDVVVHVLEDTNPIPFEQGQPDDEPMELHSADTFAHSSAGHLTSHA